MFMRFRWRTPPDDGSGGTPPPDKGDGGQAPPQTQGGKTFTQEELDRIIADRLGREREKTKDYDELKKKADELKKLQDAQLSEQERQKKELDEATVAKADLEARLKAKELEAQGILIRAEVRVQAVKLGFANPDDAYALADLGAVKVTDSGEVSGVDKALEKLAKDRPYLLGKESGATGTPRRAAPGGQPKPGDKPPAPERPLVTL